MKTNNNYRGDYYDNLDNNNNIIIIKQTVKLSLCLINKALCHEYKWGSGGTAPPFLTSALFEEWSTSRP
jgi:hypothetical protein